MGLMVSRDPMLILACDWASTLRHTKLKKSKIMGETSRKTFKLSPTMEGVAQAFKGKGYIHFFDKRKNKNKNVTLNVKEGVILQRKLHKILTFLKHTEKSPAETMTNGDDSERSSESDFE